MTQTTVKAQIGKFLLFQGKYVCDLTATASVMSRLKPHCPCIMILCTQGLFKTFISQMENRRHVGNIILGVENDCTTYHTPSGIIVYGCTVLQLL